MGNGLIGFFAGAGVATWVYSKMMKSTGNNTRDSLIVAVIAGAATWILGIFILGAINVNLD